MKILHNTVYKISVRYFDLKLAFEMPKGVLSPNCALGRSENPGGGRVVIGVHNLSPRLE